jgi:HD superfamily phosphohydrolase
MNFETHIRDPIHGYIGVTSEELSVIDSPQFQRLRDITQLSAVDRVYPSATHTRFQHSIGVMDLSWRLGKQVSLTDRELRCVRLAGLLHDIGHPVWSHTGESVTELYGLNHEGQSEQIIKDVQHLFNSDTERVIQYVQGNAKTNVVNGLIDADKMDYLVRDAYYTGVKHGAVDVETILQFATKTRAEQLGFRRKTIPALNELLNARLKMYQSVYFHPTVQAFDSVLQRALHRYTKHNQPEQLVTKSESELYASLSDYPAFNKYIKRKQPQTVVQINATELDSSSQEKLTKNSAYEMSKIISEEAGSNVDDVFVSLPTHSQKNFSNVRIEPDGKQIHQITDLPDRLQSEYKSLDCFSVYTYNPSKVNKQDVLRIL